MPTPERTSLPDIVAAGRQLLESDGLDALTMAAVAARVGVRPPSLYKRVRNREELVRLVAEAGVAELRDLLLRVEPGGGDPRAHLRDLVGVLRSFAHRWPATYRLLFMPRAHGTGVPHELLAEASAPLMAVTAELAGPDDALVAARTVTAWATGFLAMELDEAFRLGGEVDDAFEYGVARLAEAIAPGGR